MTETDPREGQDRSRPKLIERLLGDERIRFLLVGGFNTAFGYFVFVVVQATLGHWIGYIGSLYTSHVLASLVAFVLHRRLVFRVSGNLVIDFLRFQSVYLVSLAVNTIMLPFLVEILGWNIYLSQAVIVVVTVTASFLGHKFFSFRRPASPPDSIESKPEV